MPRRDHPRSKQASQSGDDFRKIAGIGQIRAQRLWDAGILTYEDLARRTPEEIADVTGIPAEHIASRDWIGQARELAGNLPEVSVPRQHYAAFHVELLLESDNRVRRTEVRHYQTDASDEWEGWDEERLLAFLRDRIPLTEPAPPVGAAGLEPAPIKTPDQPRVGGQSAATSQLPPGAPERLPSWSVRINELSSVRDGQRGHIRSHDEPISVRLTMRIDPIGTPIHDTLDFTAEIAAREFGERRRLPLGTTRGAIRVGDPLSVVVAGPALPVGLYRLVAAVDIYPASHPPKERPLSSHGASGDLMQVADTPLGSTSAVA